MRIGPKYKICRRLGSNIFEKCQTQKFALSESKKKGVRRRRSRSDYAQQLLEKQKARFSYGMSERQFRRFVKESLSGAGNPRDVLYRKLESRLDNIVYRLGLAKSRAMARQLVVHGHVTVNGRKVDAPSYQVKQGESVAVRVNSREKKVFEGLDEIHKHYSPPAWLAFDLNKLEGKKQGEPELEGSAEVFDVTKVIEYYSR